MTAKVTGTAAALGESISAGELESTTVVAGAYRNANFTVDADGRLTDAESWAIASADFNGDLTGPSALDTTTGVGKAFTNQPANDGVEILSSSALDITQTVTIIGTTTGTDTVVAETVALDAANGTTPVASVKVDWGVILAVKLSAACVGTVTVREASADATITTLAPAALTAGVELVAAPDQSAWNRTVSLASDGATTKQVGLQGMNSSGTVIYDSQALSGTTAVLSNSAFVTVTEIYTGDVENTRTVTQTATAGTKLDGSKIVTETGTATLTNKTLTDPIINAATGTAQYRAVGVVEVDTTSASTDADLNEKDLWTYSLPAGTLDVNGRAVRITAWGTSGANANPKNIRLYFGATALRLFTTTINNSTWFMEAIVVRTGAATQVSRAWGGAGTTFQVMGVGTPAATLSGAVTIKVTGQNGVASAGDIVFSGAIVELLP